MLRSFTCALRCASGKIRPSLAHGHGMIQKRGIHFERDNRSIIKKKVKRMDKGHHVSKKLLKCRTSKEFLKYAKKKGADLETNSSNRVKVRKNGVTTGFRSPGRKGDLQNSVRKQKIEAFKAMGIAWDD